MTEAASDEALLERYAQNDDDAALAALVARHGRRLDAFLRALSPSDADAEDAFQETWLRVVKNARRYRGGSFAAFLFRIARSVATDRFRRSGRRGEFSADACDEAGVSALDGVADGAPTPQEQFESRATERDVLDAVRTLPPGQRDVFLMRVEGDLTFREIAAELGVPLGTALAWMQRATVRLRKLLEDDYA